MLAETLKDVLECYLLNNQMYGRFSENGETRCRKNTLLKIR